MPPPSPVLRAPGPREWCDQHLRAAVEEHGPGEHGGPWLSLDDLLADDLAVLRRRHAQCLSEGATGPAGAKWLASEYGGQVVTSVAFVLGFADAGVVVDPGSLRWRRHPGGWSDRLALGERYRVVVAPDHPWAARPDVDVVPREEVARSALSAAVLAARPLVEACRSLAKVGRNALWAEVADGAASAVAHRYGVPVSERICGAIGEAVRDPALPWRTAPELQVVEHADGPLYAVRKGGCCLVYLSEAPGAESDPEPAEDAYAAFHAAYEERFPTVPGTPAYCSTCSLRPLEECVERQVWHRAHRHLLPG